MTYFQRNTFLFTAWCQVLFNVLLHYVTAESYLHYNKGIFYKIVSGLLHAAFGPRYNVLIIDHVLKSGPSISHTIRPPTHVFPMLIKARKMSQRPNELILWMSGFCFNKKWNNDILHALTLLFSIQFCKVECMHIFKYKGISSGCRFIASSPKFPYI